MHATPPLPPAERGTRLLAASIDELILLALCLPMVFGAVTALLPLASTDPTSIGTPEVLHALLQGPGLKLSLAGFVGWSAVTAWLVTNNGQSIGKRAVGIKVVRTDGSRASFIRIFLLRNVVNSLPALFPAVGLLYQLVDPLFIFQQSRRCLHDLIADTIVVRCAPGAGA
jgi:uncharacterized RDD family membrane protein YckC